MAALPSPNAFDVESLGNWFHNNKPLIREEADFINHADDLVALAPQPPLGTLDRYVHKLLRIKRLGRLGDAVGDGLDAHREDHLGSLKCSYSLQRSPESSVR